MKNLVVWKQSMLFLEKTLKRTSAQQSQTIVSLRLSSQVIIRLQLNPEKQRLWLNTHLIPLTLLNN